MPAHPYGVEQGYAPARASSRQISHLPLPLLWPLPLSLLWRLPLLSPEVGGGLDVPLVFVSGLALPAGFPTCVPPEEDGAKYDAEPVAHVSAVFVTSDSNAAAESFGT